MRLGEATRVGPLPWDQCRYKRSRQSAGPTRAHGPSKARKQASPRPSTSTFPSDVQPPELGAIKPIVKAAHVYSILLQQQIPVFHSDLGWFFSCPPLAFMLFICNTVRVIGLCLYFFGVLPPFLLIDLCETGTWF